MFYSILEELIRCIHDMLMYFLLRINVSFSTQKDTLPKQMICRKFGKLYLLQFALVKVFKYPQLVQ